MTTLFTSIDRENIVKCLARGDDINEVDLSNQFGQDRTTPFVHHCKNDNQDVVIALLDYNCDVNYRDLSYYNGLDYVCINGNSSLLQKILKYKTIRDIINPFNVSDTPLLLACCRGYMDIYDILIANGADIDITDHDGMTSLMVAVQWNKIDMVIKLLNDGANPDRHDDYQGFALRYCKNKDILLQLLTYNANPNNREYIWGRYNFAFSS